MKTVKEMITWRNICISVTVLASIGMFLCILYFPAILNMVHGSRTYSGKVVDAETGEPIARAYVSGSYNYYESFSPYEGHFYKPSVSVKTRTDRKGEFTITLKGINHQIAIHAAHNLYKTEVLGGAYITDSSNFIIELEPEIRKE